MKKILLGLIFSISCYAVPAFVQGTICGGSSPITCAMPGNVTSGNLIVVAEIEVGDPATTVTDTQGNTYTLSYHDTGRGNRQYTTAATSTGALSVVFTRSGAFNVVIAEYSGINIAGAGSNTTQSDGGGSVIGSQQRVANGTALSMATGSIAICSVRDYSDTTATPTDGQWTTGDILTFRTGFHELTALFDTVATTTYTGATGFYNASTGNNSAGGCSSWLASGGPPPSTVITRRFIGMGR